MVAANKEVTEQRVPIGLVEIFISKPYGHHHDLFHLIHDLWPGL